MMEQMPDSAYLLDGLLDDNPLPASYVVQLRDLGDLEDTVAQIETVPGVLRIRAPTDVAAAPSGPGGDMPTTPLPMTPQANRAKPESESPPNPKAEGRQTRKRRAAAGPAPYRQCAM